MRGLVGSIQSIHRNDAFHAIGEEDFVGSDEMIQRKMSFFDLRQVLEYKASDNARAAPGCMRGSEEAITLAPEEVSPRRAGHVTVLIEQNDFRRRRNTQRLGVRQVAKGLEAGIPILAAKSQR